MVNVLVPILEGFEEIEAITIIDVLRRAGIKVTAAGLAGNMVTGRNGVKLYTDDRMIDSDSTKYDAIVLPGGPAYKEMIQSQLINLTLHDFFKKGKIIGAICAGPIVLAKAGILKEKRATCYPGMERELDFPRPDKVMVDGNIITSQAPGTAMEFSLTLVKKLVGAQKADQLRKELVVG
jgi:protein deglycase